MSTWPSFGEGTGRIPRAMGFPISFTRSAFCILVISVRNSEDCLNCARIYGEPDCNKDNPTYSVFKDRN